MQENIRSHVCVGHANRCRENNCTYQDNSDNIKQYSYRI